MKRSAATADELDDFEEERTQPSVQTPRSIVQLVTDARAAGGGDLVLIHQSAQLAADLQVTRDQLEALQARQKWLWGGLAVSGVLIAFCVMHKRRHPTSVAVSPTTNTRHP